MTTSPPAKIAKTTRVTGPKLVASNGASTLKEPVVHSAPGPKAKKAAPKFAAATQSVTRIQGTEMSPSAAPPTPQPPFRQPAIPQLPDFKIPAATASATQPLTKMVKNMVDHLEPSATRYEEMASFGKANMNALMEANSVFLSGVQEFSKEIFSLTQQTLEQAAAATSAMLAAKTLKDVMALNSEFAKANYEKMLHNTTKLGELTVKLATATAAPITARATHLVEKSVRPLS